MALDIPNRDHVGRVAGRTVLFIGGYCKYWTIDRFVQAARESRALGIDTICPKRLDGTVKWYGDKAHLQAEAKAVRAAGCGYIPFSYSYGPAFGPDFVTAECACLTEMQEAMAELEPDGIGFACADLEAEFNGQIDAARKFNAAMQNKHLLWLTSWADPSWQSWNDVLNIIRGCINCYVPQSYSDLLSTLEYQQIPSDLCLQTAVDLSQEFGVNHPVDITNKARAMGQTTVWMWDYSFIGPYIANVRGVVNAMKGVSVPAPSPAPVPTSPAPTPAPTTQAYTIQPGDSLSAIAESHGIANWRDLLNKNRAILDKTAQMAGYADCQDGNLIFPGTTIYL